jgi:hypothetical protein
MEILAFSKKEISVHSRLFAVNDRPRLFAVDHRLSLILSETSCDSRFTRRSHRLLAARKCAGSAGGAHFLCHPAAATGAIFFPFVNHYSMDCFT